MSDCRAIIATVDTDVKVRFKIATNIQIAKKIFSQKLIFLPLEFCNYFSGIATNIFGTKNSMLETTLTVEAFWILWMYSIRLKLEIGPNIKNIPRYS